MVEPINTHNTHSILYFSIVWSLKIKYTTYPVRIACEIRPQISHVIAPFQCKILNKAPETMINTVKICNPKSNL